MSVSSEGPSDSEHFQQWPASEQPLPAVDPNVCEDSLHPPSLTRRIPRHFEDVPLSDEGTDNLDNVDASGLKEVMLAEDFDLKHLEDFSVRKSLQELDNDPSGRKIEFLDNWKQASVTIKIPTKSKDDDARPFSVPGFHFRPLVEPFKRLWKDPLDNHEERVFDELYTSDSWLDAQDQDPLFTSGGDKLVATLDARFHQVPTFGNGAIRMFANNTSEMKKLAARDFEDILQCAIPVFEGLFPDSHDMIVQSLLYRFAQWHALAKLRIHTELSLGFLEETFTILSKQLRKFRDFTCAVFETVELPKEKAARQRRFAQRAGPNDGSSESGGPRVKKFNLSTYKFHAMGNYVRTIKLFGMTDSFTTQIGELVHRVLKAFYPLTSKLDTPSQLAKHERRRRVLQEHNGDPATKNFISKLKDHILYRLKKLDVSHCDCTFSNKEHNSVIIPNNIVYSVKTMQVHYTTYDMRREYDTINPNTNADIMVLSGETSPSHPYWYTRVLGIYHIDTWLEGSRTEKQHLTVLHVRWLAPLISSDHQSGIQCARLPKLAFVEESDYDTFGFLDPGQVIQGTHLIPAFVSGCGVTSLHHGNSLARAKDELDDWKEFHVGIFVDRDMFIRYTDLGVGHPVALRRIVRDCSTLESATTPVEDDSMDVDQQIDVDLQLDSEGEEDMESESEDEHDLGCNGIEGGEWDKLAPAVESDDNLSF
ncbi:uncharacterized protein EDB91DRAFT_1254428 [Suillus paluster]|uniref:uncharacterized protein n=1 Tax=Suillus paluster TaxID=48578 RepID=UPI001B87005C|nr:uncharacterized protein EDB91DRAFT_1254428 [Suillus paluster]KAG1726169.1 hypothetical protein EDB91DRAFT_1254428 [Suillus paluster]